MELTNEKLKATLKKIKNEPNKELLKTVLGLKHDHEVVKAHIIELTNTMDEIEYVYNAGYYELNNRLKFDDTE